MGGILQFASRKHHVGGGARSGRFPRTVPREILGRGKRAVGLWGRFYAGGICGRVSTLHVVAADLWRRAQTGGVGTQYRRMELDPRISERGSTQGDRAVAPHLRNGAASLRVEPEPRKNPGLGRRKRRRAEI